MEITKNQVKIVSREMEVAVPSDDGEDDVLRVDADGVHAEVVEADQIVSESVVHTQGAASYTPANAGELAVILEELSGKHLTGRVYIDCKNVTSGNYTIANLSGEGIVTLTNGTMNQLKIDSCGSTTVYVLKVKFSSAGTALLLENSSALFISGCTINASVGIAMGDDWPTKAIVYNCGGDCSVMARVNWASELRVQGSGKPTGTISLTNGAEVYNATPDPTFAAKPSPSIPTTQTVTVSLSPTSTSTSGYGSKLYQGRYSSSQSLRKGVMLFTLPTDLANADSIDSDDQAHRRRGSGRRCECACSVLRCAGHTLCQQGSLRKPDGEHRRDKCGEGHEDQRLHGPDALQSRHDDRGQQELYGELLKVRGQWRIGRAGAEDQLSEVRRQ